MRIAFFGAKRYDRVSFDAANAAHGFAIQYLEARLTAETARLAEGFPVACTFVNDDLAADVLELLAAGGTKMLALRCAGFNNVDLVAAKACGLVVARVPAYSPHAVAEHALALLLTLNRKTHKAFVRVREGNFSLDGLTGFDLFGKTAAVVGTGKIGACTVQILRGFGMRVLAVDVNPNPDAVAAGAEYVPLETALAAADVVTLHCPLMPDTFHIIDEKSLSKMKRGVVIVNTSRGGLVDARAALVALKTGHLGGLAMDVYEEEAGVFFEDHTACGLRDDVLARLLTFPNVLVTGHQGFLTAEALANIAETTLANVARFARGEPCPNRIAG